MGVAEFRNEPLTDFNREENRRAYRAALDLVGSRLGQRYALVIGGERMTGPREFVSTNPADPREVVGVVNGGGREQAGWALDAAVRTFPAWARVDPRARARILWKAAALLRRRKFEFSALLTLEVGKTYPEADADTAEAIDFLEFYGREMVRLAGIQPLTRFMGEDNELYYEPLGAGVVHSPFNFPLAIMAGMTVAAVVTGNTVVLKPSVHAPVVAAWFVELLEQAGLPPGVVNFLPADPAEVSDLLTTDPRVHFISFTGSAAVGVKLVEQAARLAPGQRHLRRVVAEMGGKDSIVVDAGYDLDEAAAGVVASAFGFSGQKCSAASRCIAVGEAYEPLLERVVRLTGDLILGDPRRPEVQVGPVANEGAYRRILEYIEVGRQEGRLACGGGPAPEAGPGYFIQPTVFADVDPRARIAQEEIFGPVLAFHRARTYADAIAMANDTPYGLTGAVYSRSREHLEYARREYHVGNLYLNRKCTGALVGVHPFGGFKLSGTDAKAGGRDHLLSFLQAKAVAEQF